MTMTKEKAIQILSTRDAHGVLCGYTSGVTEALDMAIEALSQPIIAKCYEIDDDHIYCSPEVAHKIFNALKDRPQGKWISQEYDDLKISDYCCSVCGTYRDDIENYCPNCGADMRGGTE